MVIWQGRGLIALVVPFFPLALFIALADMNLPLAFTLSGITLVASGGVCWHFGRKWNRAQTSNADDTEDWCEYPSSNATKHSLYFIPLQYWGLLSMLIGGMFASLWVVAQFVKR